MLGRRSSLRGREQRSARDTSAIGRAAASCLPGVGRPVRSVTNADALTRAEPPIWSAAGRRYACLNCAPNWTFCLLLLVVTGTAKAIKFLSWLTIMDSRRT